MEKLKFPWILSSETNFFNDLHGNLGGSIFVGARAEDVRFIANGLEIVESRKDAPPPLGLGQDIEPPTGFWNAPYCASLLWKDGKIA
jgi:hypothetical protein